MIRVRALWSVTLVIIVCLTGVGAASAEQPLEPAKKPDTVRVAGIVLKWLRMDKEASFRRGEKMIRESAARGAQVVVTTEGWLDGYMIEDRTIPLWMYRQLAEPVPDGEYFIRIGALAHELRIYLAAGLTEIDGEHTYNTAALIGPDGRLIGKYRKEKVGWESLRNTAGEGAKVFDTELGRIGLRICADRSYPDVVKRTCEAGADLVIFLSGGVYGPKNTPTIQARSRENRRHMIFVHPCEFLVTAPDGTVLKDILIGEVREHPPENWFRNDIFNVHALARGMLIGTEQIGTDVDKNAIVCFDLHLPQRRP